MIWILKEIISEIMKSSFLVNLERMKKLLNSLICINNFNKWNNKQVIFNVIIILILV